MEDRDYPKIPEDAFFNEEDTLCHADGKPVDDGVYKNENGDLVIIEGNSGDIFLPE